MSGVKVWIAFSGAYENRSVVGVYATKEAAVAVAMPDALAWRRHIERIYPDQAKGWKPVSEDDCDIEEHEVLP